MLQERFQKLRQEFKKFFSEFFPKFLDKVRHYRARLLANQQIRLPFIVAGVMVGVLLGTLLFVRLFRPASPSMQDTLSTVSVGNVADYASAAALQQRALADAMTSVGLLLANPQLGDAAWQAEVAKAMDDVDLAYSSLVRLEPDASLVAYHARMLEGAADCSAAMRVLDLALDEQNRDAVLIVVSLLNRCQAHINAAGELVAD